MHVYSHFCRIDERKILFLFGLVPMVLARVLMFPFGGNELTYTKPNDTSSHRGKMIRPVGSWHQDYWAKNAFSARAVRPAGTPDVLFAQR